MKRLVALALIAATCFVVIHRIVGAASHRKSVPAIQPFAQPSGLSPGGLTDIRGAAQGVIRHREADGDRHVDTARTIERLRALNANTYQFLIEGPDDWSDLVNDFMPEAERTGLRVIAYLVPPTECPSTITGDGSCDRYQPYHADYRSWASAIGRLSARYPNLFAWTIDDIDYNLAIFTPTATAELNALARAAQPSLDFLLQLYAPSITPAFVAAYAPAFAGVIVPFRDGTNVDTMVTSSAAAEIDALSAMLRPYRKQLIIMVYANRLGPAPGVPPDTDYVTDLVRTSLAKMGAGEVSGVVTWNLPIGRAQRQRRRRHRDRPNRCRCARADVLGAGRRAAGIRAARPRP